MSEALFAQRSSILFVHVESVLLQHKWMLTSLGPFEKCNVKALNEIRGLSACKTSSCSHNLCSCFFGSSHMERYGNFYVASRMVRILSRLHLLYAIGIVALYVGLFVKNLKAYGALSLELVVSSGVN
ncbi:hypothetical protein V6N11_077118 [Hibiscus sabdariffa]|uniref:Uncharacterized protein n=1 Tax=Hibiscus sabdariffa TaxID=183260 RepID=A0ABR2TC53_9ROSI